MLKGLYTAYTGMVQEQRRLDVLTNNLANADTTGYKKEAMVTQAFDDMMSLRIKDTSSIFDANRTGYISLGAKVGETYTNWDMGNFKETGNNFDLAIGGNGFFAIAFTNKNGETSVKYTRDGSFTVNREGYLVTTDGDYVLNQNGAMNADPSEGNRIRVNPNLPFMVDELGNVTQMPIQNGGNAVAQANVLGVVGLVDFENYDYLEKYGENLYDTIPGYQAMAATGSINQGYLEASNVNVVTEMVDMITIQRAYEAGQKVIQTMDSTLGIAATQVGKV